MASFVLDEFSLEVCVDAVECAVCVNDTSAHKAAQAVIVEELVKQDVCPVHAQRLHQLCEVTVGHQKAFVSFMEIFALNRRKRPLHQ